jgi:hypothetical protein
VTDGDRAGRLLSGPRGRRLCAELLASPDGGLTSRWPGRTDRRTALVDVRRALQRTDLDTVAGSGRLDAALLASVDWAFYWQEPDAVDAVLADEEVAVLLAPVADAVARASGSRWWTSPMDPDGQYALAWLRADGSPPVSPRATGARAGLEAWREWVIAAEARAARELPPDPRAAFSGEWWSTPAMAGLVVTSRSRPEDPGSGAGGRTPSPVPVGLTLVEDESGWPSARTWPVHPPATARVHELTGPEEWIALVEDHPLVVTASRRHDWWRATGWAGRWAMPDWAAVAERFDAVHLTVDGYLSTAGRALPVDLPGAPARTLLAGWDPDATWWLADVLAEPGEPTDWRRRDDEPTRWEPAG